MTTWPAMLLVAAGVLTYLLRVLRTAPLEWDAGGVPPALDDLS